MDPAIEKARAMRKAMTPPELRLWKCLRRLRAEGRHFRRQTPFRGYFLDFVCHRSRLVIEVDGQMHDYRVEHDRTRDAVLLREGYRTLRFTNEAVRDHIDWVMDRIRTELAAGIPHPGSPDGSPSLPMKGRENRAAVPHPSVAARQPPSP